jgi:hypothetical protein
MVLAMIVAHAWGKTAQDDQLQYAPDLRAGINKLLDKDPPIVTNPALQGGGQADTFATYDVLGRQLYAAFTAKF